MDNDGSESEVFFFLDRGQLEIGQSTKKNCHGTMRANFRRCLTRLQERTKTFTE